MHVMRAYNIYDVPVASCQYMHQYKNRVNKLIGWGMVDVYVLYMCTRVQCVSVAHVQDLLVVKQQIPKEANGIVHTTDTLPPSIHSNHKGHYQSTLDSRYEHSQLANCDTEKHD